MERLQTTAKGFKDLPGKRKTAPHGSCGISEGAGFCRVDKEAFTFASPKTNGKHLFVMDNDPSQNSEVAQATLKELNCELVAIPPCSPDLNPIENSFHIRKSSAENDGIEY